MTADAPRNHSHPSRRKFAPKVERALDVVLGNSVHDPLPPGYAPIGGDVLGDGVEPGDIPQKLEELGELQSHAYDLTIRRAGELNIPVIGSVSGGFDRRVIVYEWTQYKEVPGEKDVQYRYGYVIRFCLTVSSWDVKFGLKLTFLAAKAELDNIQAAWLMQVRGLSGPEISKVILPPQSLEVQTFVLARQSLESAIRAIYDPTTRFHPGIVVGKVEPTSGDIQQRLGAVRTFATYSLARGRSAVAAQARLGSTEPAELDVITETYAYFGVADPNATPGSQSRESARKVLGGIKADL